MVKKIIICLTFIFCGLVGKAQTRITIVNNLGVNIYQIYASAAGQYSFSADLLNDSALEPEDRISIYIPDNIECEADIKVKISPDYDLCVTYTNADVCSASTLILQKDKKIKYEE